jgi:hypothetical protein
MDAKNRESAADTVATTTSIKREAAETIDRSRVSAANVLSKTADTLHASADQFSKFGHMTAARLQATAEHIRDTEFEDIIHSFPIVVNRYPAQSMIAAAIAGFAIAHLMRRTAQ